MNPFIKCHNNLLTGALPLADGRRGEPAGARPGGRQGQREAGRQQGRRQAVQRGLGGHDTAAGKFNACLQRKPRAVHEVLLLFRGRVKKQHYSFESQHKKLSSPLENCPGKAEPWLNRSESRTVWQSHARTIRDSKKVVG